MTVRSTAVALSLCGLMVAARTARATERSSPPDPLFQKAAENGARSEEVFRRTRRMMNAWLAYADPRTLLLPDHLPGYKRSTRPMDLYTPHNSGADNYPYLVATAYFTDRALYEGRMRDMLRSEIRYTDTGDGIPGQPRARRRASWGRPASSARPNTRRTASSPSPSCSAARRGSTGWRT